MSGCRSSGQSERFRGQHESAILERWGEVDRLAIDPRRGAAGGERDDHTPSQGMAAPDPGRPPGVSPGVPGGMEKNRSRKREGM